MNTGKKILFSELWCSHLWARCRYPFKNENSPLAFL